MKLRVIALLLLACAQLLAQSGEVEITAEPNHKLLLQNDRVRVFKADVPAHGRTLLHRHRHDYFIIALAAADAVSEVPGKPPAGGKLKLGEVHFAPGGFAHLVSNLSDSSFPTVDVEIMQPTSFEWDEERGVNVLEGGTQEILFVKDGVRASETDLQPHAMIPRHTHKVPHLVIAVSDIDLESTVEGKPVTHTRLKSGEVAWVPGGLTHTVMNAGHQNAKYVALEFPPIGKN